MDCIVTGGGYVLVEYHFDLSAFLGDYSTLWPTPIVDGLGMRVVDLGEQCAVLCNYPVGCRRKIDAKFNFH